MGRAAITDCTVAVFGATGFVGRYLVNRLGQSGLKIKCAFRGDEYDVWPLRQMGELGHIKPMRFHLSNPESIRQIVNESDVTVNLMAQDRKSWNFTVDQVNVEGARMISKASVEAGSQLIHVSHLAASEGNKSEFLRSKYEGEQQVRESNPEAIIVRPGSIFGQEDRFTKAIATFLRLPMGVPVLGKGSAIKYPVYVGDVAEGLHQIILNRDTIEPGTVFDFCGPQRYTWLDVIEWLKYYSMKNFKVFEMENPRLFNWYSRIGVDWRRPMFTTDLAVAWTEDERLGKDSATFKYLGMNDLATLDKMAIQLTRYLRPQEHYEDILPLRRTVDTNFKQPEQLIK